MPKTTVHSWTRALLLLVVMSVVLVGCTHGTKPPHDLPAADLVSKQLAEALSKLDVKTAPVVDAPAAQQDLDVITDGVGTLKPTVTPGSVSYDKQARTATAHFNWEWPTTPQPWKYTSQAKLTLDGNHWKLVWTPSVVNQYVTSTSRIDIERVLPKRGTIYGNGGKALVTYRDVVKIGLDKTQVPREKWDSSARALATLCQENPDEFAKAVAAAGDKAFVLLITLRGTVAPNGIGNIAGARAILDKMSLGPYKGFAAPVLGSVGEATKEIIDKSHGKIQVGDIVGLSGLQKWHDETLRGSAGLNVLLVKRRMSTPTARPAGSPTLASSATPSETTVPLPAMLFQVKPVDGKDLTITLDEALQQRAEEALRDNPQPMAFAIVQPSTAKILALAVSTAANGQQLANAGRYAPGSTFKIATSLGLLRAGMTADTVVECPQEIVVDGRKITNYPGYPDVYAGQQPLKNVVAYSCNTAFVANRDKLGDNGLAEAAASLGIGIDYDTQFEAFYGDVPKPTSETGRAEQVFGQGTILVSPMTVAGMSASVAAGKTVIPYLVEGFQAKSKAKPLTTAEATELRKLMENVVAIGTAQNLQGVAVGAKTGTAEFGADPAALKQHLWITGYTANDIAFAIFQNEGKLSLDLAPIIKQVLT